MDSFMEMTKDGVVTTQSVDGVLVLHFRSGRIREEREILRIFNELGEYIESNAPCDVLLNMQNIEYLSSAGLGAMVGLLKKTRQKNGRLKLCCLQDSIYELFEVMRLTKIFEIFQSEPEAMKSFASG